MSGVVTCSQRALDLVERFALARKRKTECPHGAPESAELIASFDELVTYIAGLEATIAALAAPA